MISLLNFGRKAANFLVELELFFGRISLQSPISVAKATHLLTFKPFEENSLVSVLIFSDIVGKTGDDSAAFVGQKEDEKMMLQA